jgi:hypothetical protein
MTDVLARMRDLIQQDVGGRGLRTDPANNLITACAGDFEAACRSIAGTPRPRVGIVTGFYIPHAIPPCGETDGPLGAVFLARALVPLGIEVVLASDDFCMRALEVGITSAGLRKAVPLVRLPTASAAGEQSLGDYQQEFAQRAGRLTHLIALERVGPSHTPESVRGQPGGSDDAGADFLAEVPAEHHDRCHNMRGADISNSMSPAHRLFEPGSTLLASPCTTIGIGDGGNEIGMGKIPWEVIRRNIPRGGLIACRIPVDHLIVCGVSNWGAYALAAGVRQLRSADNDPGLFDVARECEILQLMVEEGPLVDGKSGRREGTVDDLPFEPYAEVLEKLGYVAGNRR